MTVVEIDGEALSLGHLRKGIHWELDRLRSTILKITGEKDIRDWLEAPITDNTGERAVGHSFLNDKRFRQAPALVLKHLQKERKFMSRDLAGKRVWETDALWKFFDDMERIQESLIVLIRIFSNNRGTGMCATSIRNTPDCRRIW